MDADTETEMVLPASHRIKRIRGRPVPVISVRRAKQQEHPVATRDSLAVKVDRVGCRPREMLDRRVEANRLLNQCRDFAGVLRYELPDLWVRFEEQEHRPDQRVRCLTPCREEQKNQPPEDLVHRIRPRALKTSDN